MDLVTTFYLEVGLCSLPMSPIGILVDLEVNLTEEKSTLGIYGSIRLTYKCTNQVVYEGSRVSRSSLWFLENYLLITLSPKKSFLWAQVNEPFK